MVINGYIESFIKTLNVKIEFCPFDWYSCSRPTAIILYKRMYMCKMLLKNRQKLKKNAIEMK